MFRVRSLGAGRSGRRADGTKSAGGLTSTLLAYESTLWQTVALVLTSCAKSSLRPLFPLVPALDVATAMTRICWSRPDPPYVFTRATVVCHCPTCLLITMYFANQTLVQRCSFNHARAIRNPQADDSAPVVCRAQQRQALGAALFSREAAAREQEQAARPLDERVFSRKLEGGVV